MDYLAYGALIFGGWAVLSFGYSVVPAAAKKRFEQFLNNL